MLAEQRDGHEGRWALLVATVAVLLTSGPRLYLYLTAPSDSVFLGQVWGVYDIPRYLLLVREAAGGAWLFDNRAGGPVHTAFLLYTPYIALGHLLGWTGLPPLAMMEVGRWIASAVALSAGWLFIRRALPAGQRALAYFAAVLAGGLGLLVLFSHPQTPLGPALPLDITAPSFTILNSLNMAPHIALAAGGLAIFGWGLLAAAGGDWRGLLGAAALVAVATFHAFVVPMALVAGGIFFLWRARRREVFVLLAIATLMSVPFGLYQLSLSSAFHVSGPDYAELENLPSLLLSRALLWPFIGIGAWAVLRDSERRPGPSLALCWAATALAFDLFPPFAGSELHRTVEGSAWAYGVLAAPGLFWLGRRPRVYLLVGALLAPILGTAFLILGGPYQPEAFLPAGYLALAQRLDRQGETRCVVGADLTMLWVTALSHVCDAQDDGSKVPAMLRGLSAAPTSEAAVDLLPQPGDLVIWGDFEIRYGPPPPLPIVAREPRTILLSP